MENDSVVKRFVLPLGIIGVGGVVLAVALNALGTSLVRWVGFSSVLTAVSLELVAVALLVLIMRKTVSADANPLASAVAASVGADIALGLFCVGEYYVLAVLGLRHSAESIPTALVIIFGSACFFLLVALVIVYFNLRQKPASKLILLFDGLVALFTVIPAFLVCSYIKSVI